MKNIMRRLTLTIIFLGFGISLLFAQNRLSDRVEQNLIQLGRKIEQIRVLADRYKNAEALRTIQNAQEDFDEALSLLKEWKNNRNRLGLLEQARAKYLSANLKANLASRLILFKPAANLLNQLDRLIQQAESFADAGNSNDLRYYLNKARNFYRKAKNSFSDNRYLRGHEYLKVATYFAEKVIAIAKKDQNPNNRYQRFDEYKNNIQVLVNRVATLIEDDDILRDLYNNVQDYLRRANNANNQGNLKQAFSNLQIAERLIHRIIDLSEDSDNNSANKRIENDYQSLGRYLNTLQNEIESSNRQSNIFNKAEELYAKAGRNIDAGQYQQAALNLKLAQRMALRAFNKISTEQNTPDSEDLQSRLNEVSHLIQLQEQRLQNEQNRSLNVLLEQAKDYHKQAQQNYQDGKFARASFLINMTLRLLNNNEKLIKRETQNNISTKTILQDLNRVEQIINRLKQNTSLNEKQQIKIDILDNLFIKARNEYDNQDFVISREILAIIQNQLTNILDN